MAFSAGRELHLRGIGLAQVVETTTKEEPEPKAAEEKAATVEDAKPVAATAPSASPPAAAAGASEQAVLYRVRATHRYTAEDSDELSFEAGEVIDVLQFDDPEEQDEGSLHPSLALTSFTTT